jgi:cyclophilin family peptidyl-prolyl cis-trans isomerase
MKSVVAGRESALQGEWVGAIGAGAGGRSGGRRRSVGVVGRGTWGRGALAKVRPERRRIAGLAGDVRCAALESLEGRALMSITINSPVADQFARPGSADTIVPLAGVFSTTNLSAVVGTVVTMPVSYYNGNTMVNSAVNFELYDSATPLAAQNFVNYVTSGRYNGTFFNYASSSIVQAGGYTFTNQGGYAATPKYAAIPNEFATSPRSSSGGVNVLGTLAAAKDDLTNPNSATSSFIVNLANNANPYDTYDGGYTVFGHVIGGLSTLFQIAALPTYSLDSTFTQIPLSNYDGTPGDITVNNLATVSSPAVVANPQTYFTYNVTISNSRVVTGTLDSNGNLDLKYSTKNSGVATVTYTATDLTGAFSTDSFVVTVAAPAITVTSGTTKVTNGQTTPLNLGTVFTGQVGSALLTIKNTGKGVLNLGSVTLPTGFTLAQQLPTTLNPGITANLQLSIDTSVAATYSGTISITNDATTGPFTFPVTVSVGSSVQLGSGATSLTYVDADGTTATYTYRGPGTANLSFSGTGLTATTTKTTVVVTGTNVSTTAVVLAGTTSGSGLTAALRGGTGAITLQSLTAGGAVGTLALKGISIGSTLTLPASATSVTLASLAGATASLGAVGTLTAASISGGLLSVGSGKALTLGSVTGAALQLGPVTTLSTTGVSGSTLNVGSVSTLKLGVVVGSTLAATGSVKALTATSISGSSVAVSGSVSSAMISGALQSDAIAVSGALVKLQAASLISSVVSSGLAAGVSTPATSSDFVAGSSVGQLTLTSRGADAFAGSSIFALSLGKLSLGTVTAGGSASSLAGGSIALLGFKNSLGKAFSLKAVASTSAASELLVAAGVPEGRLSASVLTAAGA